MGIHLFRVTVVGQPTIAMIDHRLTGMFADDEFAAGIFVPDREMRAFFFFRDVHAGGNHQWRRLGRAGVSQSYIIEIVELSVMGKLVLAPQSTKDSDAFGEVACAAFIKQIGIEIGSSSNGRQRSVLAFMNRAAAAAGTGAQDWPPLGHFVQCRPGLGKVNGISKMRYQDAGAKPDTFGLRRNRRQNGRRIKCGRRSPAHHAVVHPYRIKPHGFGFAAGAKQVLQRVSLAGDPGHVVDGNASDDFVADLHKDDPLLLAAGLDQNAIFGPSQRPSGSRHIDIVYLPINIYRTNGRIAHPFTDGNIGRGRTAIFRVKQNRPKPDYRKISRS